MDALSLDKKVSHAVLLLCSLVDKGGRAPLRIASEEAGCSYSTACEIISKLGVDIVSSESGRHGGIKIVNENVTIGEISKKLGLVCKLGDSLHQARFKTALNKLNRIRISDLTERDF